MNQQKRKYVEGYGFLSFAKKLVDRYGKKTINIATKTGMDDAKTASKRVVQKTAEDTGELIVNKIADKIRARSKDKEREDEANKIETFFIEKTQQVLQISLGITSKWNTKNVQTS